MPYSVVMHPSWEQNWIVPSPITLLIAEFSMKTSPPWTEVYEENIFLLELICYKHSESIIYLFLLPTELSITDRTSHLFSSPSATSLTLASYCFFLRLQQSALMCPLLRHQFHTKFLRFGLPIEAPLLLFFLVKCACQKLSWWDSLFNFLSILSL